MKTYLFSTKTMISERYQKKYWVDRNLIPDIKISAGNLDNAIVKFQSHCEENFVQISNSGLKKKNAIYCGKNEQVGLIFVASTEIDNKKIIVNLWVEIDEVTNPFLKSK